MLRTASAAVIASFVFTASALASTISVETYGGSNAQLDQFQTDFGAKLGGGNYVGEDFEQLGADLGEGEVVDPFETAAGTFSRLTDGAGMFGTGSGGTVTQLPGNTGENLALRDNGVFGRKNTWPVGGNWFLDSNDTWGFVWEITAGDVGGAFDEIVFSLTDGSDQGAFLRIELDDGTVYEQRETGKGKLGNGNIAFVTVDFGEFVDKATITVGNFTSNADGSGFKINDGVGLDGAYVNVIPLPASMAFLLAGVGALAVAREAQELTSAIHDF